MRKTPLRLSQSLLESIVNNSGNIVYVKDLAGRYLMVNDTYCTVVGVQREAVIGRTTEDLFPPETARQLTQNDRLVAVEKTVRRFEERVPRADGWHDYDTTKFPMFDEAGTLFAIGGISTDVTAHRRAEEMLRESEEKFRVAFHSNPLAINLNRVADGMYIDINEGFTRIMGYTRKEVVGRLSVDLGIWAEPADRERLVAGLLTAGRVDDLRASFRHKDGRIVKGAMWARILSFGGEQLIISLTRDITAETELEERYRQAQKMEAIGRLAGGVAHDFNNLLIPMLSYAEMLKGTLGADDHRNEMLDEIIRAGRRAADLTRQILAFSRRQVLDMKVIDLGQLIADQQKMLARLLKEDIEVRTSLAPGLHIRADRMQIEQILMNLAVNAGDAMPDGGVLSLSTSEEVLDGGDADDLAEAPLPGRYAVICVQDTGNGMDAETIKHIFEPFFTTKEKGKGTGLGLATVFGIVRQHHGRIRVTSEPGRGTAFRISLPRADLESAHEPAPSPAPRTLKGTERIMVVEDDTEVRTLVCHVLKSSAYDVIVPRNAVDALRTVREAAPHERPQLLLTDVIMPGMNGSQLSEALLAYVPDLHVLYMSGYTDEVIARHGVLEPGVNLLQKPFALDDLLVKVRTVLDTPKTVFP